MLLPAMGVARVQQVLPLPQSHAPHALQPSGGTK
jgi:hypothetical protein